MRTIAAAIAGALALCGCSDNPVPTVSTETTAIVGAAALVGPDLRLVEDAVLVIEGGSIAAVGPATEVVVPASARTVDASGNTLVPGFIDAHVHIGFYDPAEVVENGVTTVRDLAWPPARIWPLVRESRARGFDGPSIVAAGPMITAPGGYPTRAGWAPPGTGLPVSTREEAKRAVGSVAEAGATIVKVALNPPAGPTLSPRLLVAIVEEAHARSLRVTGHVAGLDQLELALAARMDELAHMLMGEDRIPEPLLRRMVDAGMAVVPTLSVREGRELLVAIDNLAGFVDAGGTVVYGTDLGNEGPAPGIDHTEIERMARAGMSARAIVASATSVSAGWLGLDAKGVLARGMDADIVALEGDIEDPASLTRVVRVWRLGRAIR